MSHARPETQPNPDLAVTASGFEDWNTPERRRAGFRSLPRISRWGISIRAPRVRALAREIDWRIGELPLVRQLTNTTAFSALAVARGDQLLYERYAPDFGPDELHATQSITKTTMTLVIGKLVEEGLIDLGQMVQAYLPEIGSGYATATVQQVLDMDVVNDYVEDYADPNSSVWVHTVSYGWRLPADGQEAPLMRDYLMGISGTELANPGGTTHYKSANTDVLALIAERVSGRSLREFYVDIVEAAGLEHVMFVATDREFRPVASGGVALSARDLARYGLLFTTGGVGVDGRRVGSQAFIDAARTNRGTSRPDGYHYSNQMVSNGRWIGHGGYGGQWLAADQQTSTAVAFFSVLENRSATDPDYNTARIALADEVFRFLDEHAARA
jgi:CubicO group peptidase (beta-lactamase class C family)